MRYLAFLTAFCALLFFSCSKSTCSDGKQNQGELGVDCGGPCTACPSCADGVQNQDETGVDCGGKCGPCPTCYDGVLNQHETQIDCGGPCLACPSCSDGIQNQGETGIDCGGICKPCATNTITNPASQNSSLQTGSGWTIPSCSISNSVSISSSSGSAVVTLNFGTPASSGTYSIANTPSPGYCSLVVTDAPNQPAGVAWYGKSGTVTVAQTTAAINVTITAAACTQKNFVFPTVTVNGKLSCD